MQIIVQYKCVSLYPILVNTNYLCINVYLQILYTILQKIGNIFQMHKKLSSFQTVEIWQKLYFYLVLLIFKNFCASE